MPHYPRSLLWKVLAALLSLLVWALPAGASPVIAEFMASNRDTIVDEDGDFSDWIEIHNTDSENDVSLGGYYLTDDSADLEKWMFPEGETLGPSARLVVFASGKNRAATGLELHTSFSLDSQGEYLALVAPDGGSVVTEFAPAYPPLPAGVSFGFGMADVLDLTPDWQFPGNHAQLLIQGQDLASVSSGADNFDLGTGGAAVQSYVWLDFSSHLSMIPAGSMISSARLEWEGIAESNVLVFPARPSKLGVFSVPDANKGVDTLTASYPGSVMSDYYAANPPDAEFGVDSGESFNAIWDIATLVQGWVEDPAASQRGQVMILNRHSPVKIEWAQGESNVPEARLTIELGNQDDSEFIAYFNTSTPAGPNIGGIRAGPVFEEVTRHPVQPGTGPLTVTAEIGSLNGREITDVRLVYRTMFDPEIVMTMADDGLGLDDAADDGIWTAEIPADAIEPGKMIRWRFEADDISGATSAEPPFREPLDSPQYWGTMGHDPNLETHLSVVHWFTENPSGANNRSGSRGAVYYLDQLYDNVLFNLHGQSTGGFPKKSYNIDFNKGQRFQWDASGVAPRVKDIDLLTNWADKSKVRHVLAYEIMRGAGVKAHFAYTVRVQQNGAFFSLADFVEDADDRWLERVGLNTEGSLYKMYSHRLNPGDSIQSPAVEKKNGAEDNSDLSQLIDGLALSGPELQSFIYDNIDIPKCVTMMAANSVIRNIDMHSKNWYIYRDSGGTNEWALLPWDLDLSQGRVWNQQNTYFDNALYTDGFVTTGTSVRLVSHLFSIPETRQMMMRRIRTLTDRYLQPESTPVAERWYERRLDEMSLMLDDSSMEKPDAQRDFEKWGSWIQPNGRNPVPWTHTDPDVESMSEAIARWKDEYLPGRRDAIYNHQTVGNGGEIPGPQIGGINYRFMTLLPSGAMCKALVPTDGSAGLDWTGVAGDFDDSGWLSGNTGVGYEEGNGYETLIGLDVGEGMMSNTSCYVRVPFSVDDLTAFDTLQLRMKWDDGFVAYINGVRVASDNEPVSLAWDSAAPNANHEADVNAWSLYDITGHLSLLRPGDNMLAIHGLNQGRGSSDFVIVPEILGGTGGEEIDSQPVIDFGRIEFNPSSGNQDEEFIELINTNSIAVDVSDWTLTGGVEFTFQPGTVIPAGGKLYLSPDVVAFRGRLESPKGGEGLFVQGGYRGHLSNFSETLEIRDDLGELNSTGSYEGDPSDNQLYLVVSELMYHPPMNADVEFIELLNISETTTLDLAGVTLTGAVDFVFPEGTMIVPGERLLVVSDRSVFEFIHGLNLYVVGSYTGSLSNGGERVKVNDPDGSTIREFTYDDMAPWPEAADSGYSLVLRDPLSNPDHSDPANWVSGSRLGGTPGDQEGLAPPVDPLGDENGNQIPDLIDYALGYDLEPNITPQFGRELVDTGNGVMETRPVIQYPLVRGASSAKVTLEFSKDLMNWSDAVEDFTLVSEEELDADRSMVTIFVNPPYSHGPSFYYRIRVALKEPGE